MQPSRVSEKQLFALFQRQPGFALIHQHQISTTVSPKIAMSADGEQEEAALAVSLFLSVCGFTQLTCWQLESSPPCAPIAPSMPSIAAPRVFGVTELLENILINLPFEDLFVLQRVDQHFNATIARSKNLRTIMHLEPQNVSGGHILHIPELLSPSWDDAESVFSQSTLLQKALLTAGIRHEHMLCVCASTGWKEIFSVFEYCHEHARMPTQLRPSWTRLRMRKNGYHLPGIPLVESHVKINDTDRIGKDATLGDVLDRFERHRNCHRQRIWVPVAGNENGAWADIKEVVITLDRNREYNLLYQA